VRVHGVAAVLPGGSTELNTGDSWFIDMLAGMQNGHVWGRTGCGFIINGTLGQCQTTSTEMVFDL